MLLAAHYSEFFPAPAFFARMKQADVFLLIDHTAFDPRGLQHRTSIKTEQGPQWLSVPLQNRLSREPFGSKRIDHSVAQSRWGGRALLTLRLAYHDAPYFAIYRDSFASVLDVPWERLAELNAAAIDFCREALGIRTPMIRSSSLGTAATDIVSLCRAAGASAFLGDVRTRCDAFEQAGIELVRSAFESPRYVQHPNPESFIEERSIVDLLFNCGPQSNLVLTGERMLAAGV